MSYGLAVIYGVMRIINLAHAGLMMLAAYATVGAERPVRARSLPVDGHRRPGVLPARDGAVRDAHPLAPALVRGPSMQSLLLLFGVWLVLQNLAYAIWGGDTQSILTPYTMESVQFLGGRFGVPQILVFVVSILSLVGLNLVLRRTYLGKAIRAVTQNRDAAMLSG
jgi:branched-chain amino acid transport system permease protein